MKDREKMQALLDGHTLRSGTTLFRLSEGGVLLRMEPGDECWEDHGDFSALHITDDIVIADGFTLTFSEAMGKVAAGETVTSLYDCSVSYCIVTGEMVEITREGGCYPVEHIPEEAMDALWSVVEVSE